MIKLDIELSKNLYAQALGGQVINYVETLRPDEILQTIESEALALLSEIKDVLDNDAIDDLACFQRIDAIVNAFYARGIQTARHDW